MLLVRHPDSYAAERTYVFGVVLGEFLGLGWRAASADLDHVEITAPEDGTARLIVADDLFATPEQSWLTGSSLPSRPLERWQVQPELSVGLVSSEVPVLYGQKLGRGGYMEERDSDLAIGADLFGSIFFQLTRYEEVATDARDEHDRFPAEASLASREGFLERPLVNEYVEILRGALARLWPRLETRRPQFQERLSHDVDWPVHPRLSFPAALKAIAGDLIRRGDRSLAAARVQARRAQRRRAPQEDPFNTFGFIMDTSERAGLKSAFYFMAGQTDPRFDGTYTPDEPWIQELLRTISDRGHEIGLHPSYGTFRDPSAIRAERDALSRSLERAGLTEIPLGGRQHFLRWENPVTWRGWEEAGLAYDSSLGYSRAAGFRCGVCYEYPVFDLLARSPLRLRERPLIVMEAAVLDTPPREHAQPLDVINQLRERCRLYGGEFTLLWHNSRLVSSRERRLYANAVEGT